MRKGIKVEFILYMIVSTHVFTPSNQGGTPEPVHGLQVVEVAKFAGKDAQADCKTAGEKSFFSKSGTTWDPGVTFYCALSKVAPKSN